ncbi:MAG: SMC-Scp complex subunit ScpB [Spirochaetes bacterium GWD1_61_31]|nr:MAG: SMC-Scp complex subunit ScpB [Spirochaetes bacterium GWB1_60_80]OHD29580.1 MAG: SMC-Scp complex subunit ScpB [Spirochaetes bacterium GWC1_61_12]OHD37485.1 MAG: SMC-Scp complex subunit ScpB [Spirochaetes bacterium GWD1_61_31]OHD42006.1 MAG: SMC-Scp complex subunit ScpB [Spirochaetes bacterium GWE1_60_18]OHD61727.1 MAG: SMC-Scp complex subunit ScpB [Spirochaetes bacterium GWF1_60_12]
MELNLDTEAAILETILYLEAEPLDIAALVRISGLSKEVVEASLEHLKETFAAPVHGLELMQVSGGWQFSPKKELWAELKERYGKKNEQKLSRAALETLSIIAYSQPVTRGEVEAIRGVAADNMIRFLLEKGFIKETGKKDAPGKPIQYGTTKDFLKFFRLNSIADLPKLDDLERERFELEPKD